MGYTVGTDYWCCHRSQIVLRPVCFVGQAHYWVFNKQNGSCRQFYFNGRICSLRRVQSASIGDVAALLSRIRLLWRNLLFIYKRSNINFILIRYALEKKLRDYLGFFSKWQTPTTVVAIETLFLQNNCWSYRKFLGGFNVIKGGFRAVFRMTKVLGIEMNTHTHTHTHTHTYTCW